MQNITVGMVAHVDAGKTTLTEAMLFHSGMIRSIGRVDHGNSHMDTDEIERSRGITVFSKQTYFQIGDTRFSVLDTPGHVDLITEAERVLPILDYAILVINATDPVQAHTLTMWKLLERYSIPVFLFVSKIDLPNPGQKEILRILKQNLGEDCISFSEEDRFEEVALRDERLLEHYLSGESISDLDTADLIRNRKIFPVCFGSALHSIGVSEFMESLSRFTLPSDSSSEFGGLVYKIIHDDKKTKYSFIKITGGKLRVRDSVSYKSLSGENVTEKITDMRLYSGMKFTSIQEADTGLVCAVAGLSQSYSGQALGSATGDFKPYTEPFMQYNVIPTDGSSPSELFRILQGLSEENPDMKISWNSRDGLVQLRLMGIIQSDVICELIRRRYSIPVSITEGRILYRETIEKESEGIGHYEPLRHFAEVHLLLKPLPRGEGLRFRSDCPPDSLDLNWQRLILTHLSEKVHLGVLTGSPVTDMEIVLKSGKAHIKHTEGGDFRQATYRAVRQGLMYANNVLLEPYCRFTLELPRENYGRALQDLQQMNAEFPSPQITEQDTVIFEGTAPAERLQNYEIELRSYSKGKGRFSCTFSHYDRCLDSERVIRDRAYQPEADLENSPDSIFCDHGVGFHVKWNDVHKYMSLPSVLNDRTERHSVFQKQRISEKEVEEILAREFGPIKRRQYTPSSYRESEGTSYHRVGEAKKYLIIDGYNLLYSMPGLEELAEDDLSHARDCLADLICNYAGFDGSDTILVFDAYKVKNGNGSLENYSNIRIVYTEENETADKCIERLCHEIGKNDFVRVVSSDALIQLSVLRAGIRRVSSRKFTEELKEASKRLRELEH